ncbi:MAG: MATE family efflux transporter [Oscillospiraceae bacterium]|nr:MATE family efflux transporter [Oscillospiraceae bacterium]
MKNRESFFKTVCSLAVPVALQSMLQSSFSMVDQIMIGQLGGVSVAGVGLAGKFASIYSVIISAVAAVAGIMLSQYLGQNNRRAARRGFCVNLLLGVGIAACFSFVCARFPERIMGVYTADGATGKTAAAYMAILSGTFLPMAGAALLSTAFRCMERPRVPLYASMLSAALNTGLNYLLIFGRLGFPAMGAEGAAIATVIAQLANVLLMLAMVPKRLFQLQSGEKGNGPRTGLNWRQYLSMLLPLLVCEVVWSLGENVYAAIYGRMGTDAAAAMTLINPIQGLVIGALCGLSQAAGILVGKRLGSGDYPGAYAAGEKLLLYGAAGALILSAAVVLTSGVYVEIYRVSEGVKAMTRQILLVYAFVAPVKVLNMILGGGIIRSGGRTKYVMLIDLIGTWCFGVPLGLLAAFVLGLSIPYVYLLLSLEEGARLGMSMLVFRGKKWMNRLEADSQ